MESFACLMVALGIAAFLCGPAALIVSIVALNKINILLAQKRIQAEIQPQPAEPPSARETLEIPTEPAETIVEEPITQAASAPEISSILESLPPSVSNVSEQAENTAAKRLSFEIFIGTRGLAIAGSIVTLVGVIFGLKYLYDMRLITPLGRTLIVTGAGIAALIIGQITRKRGYEIVATALAALGFAMLYAADFAAFGFYHIIGTNLAFGLAVIITAGGMLFSVGLNEIIVAFISLLGGFLSPVVLSSGENRPNTLFSYLLILIGGAMVCAAVRKWRWVSRLSFIGTAVLYTAWFNEWYEPAMYGNSIPEQLPVALAWLCIFAAIFLVMPVLYELIKKEIAHKGDVFLILANAMFCYIYLHQILFANFRLWLALAAVCLGGAHLILLSIVHSRCPHDKTLKALLALLGLVLITVAIPLYFRMYAVALAWAGEAIVLTFIALKYRSRMTQFVSLAAMVLAVSILIRQLPLHQGEFTLIFNNTFGSWCFVAAAIYIAHLFYRFLKEAAPEFYPDAFAQILFCSSLILLLSAICMEWYYQTEYNLAAAIHSKWFIKGIVMICSAFIILFVLPLLRPAGVLPVAAATVLSFMTCITTLAALPDFYSGPFTIFANVPFAISLAPLAALTIASVLIYRQSAFQLEMKQIACGYGLAIIFFVWLLLTEEIYLYWNYPGRVSVSSAIDKGQMWISIMWALYAAIVIAIGLWRKLITLRYISFGFFVLVLAKVFIFDMSTLEKVYRIAGFIVLGLVLIGVSYLYQYLRKSGFFEKSLPGDQNI